MAVEEMDVHGLFLLLLLKTLQASLMDQDDQKLHVLPASTPRNRDFSHSHFHEKATGGSGGYCYTVMLKPKGSLDPLARIRTSELRTLEPSFTPCPYKVLEGWVGWGRGGAVGSRTGEL